MKYDENDLKVVSICKYEVYYIVICENQTYYIDNCNNIYEANPKHRKDSKVTDIEEITILLKEMSNYIINEYNLFVEHKNIFISLYDNYGIKNIF